MNEIKGYKVFNSNWKCRDYQFEVGKTFEEDVIPECCERGFHFCVKAADCFDYYDFDSDNKVAEVLAFGDVDTDGKKSCTNKIKIVRELTWHEVLDIVNTGKDCTGRCNSGDWNSGNCNSDNRNSGNCNSGDWNSGNCNSGNCNSGNRNSGNRNSGNWNSGDCNSGNWNSGNCNSGDWNSGNCNSGNCNSGDWNKTCFSNGCFNTAEPKIYLFNKPSDWTYRDWYNSKARNLMCRIELNVKWIWASDMTEEEKSANPAYETTGGYLSRVDNEKICREWWAALTENEKNIIKSIPNFDSEIFKEITGVDVNETV